MQKRAEMNATLVGLIHRRNQKLAAIEAETATPEELSELSALTQAIEALTAEISKLAPGGDAEETTTTTTAPEKTMQGPAIIKSDKNRRYDLNKFVLAIADKTYNGGGFEIECSQEAARLSGKSTSVPVIPWGAILKAPQDAITPPSNGQDLGISLAQPRNHTDLFTFTTGASFMQSAAAQLGVPTYNAPLGEFKIARMVEAITSAWIPRDSAAALSNGLFDSIAATPHTLISLVQVNRSALVDCDPPMQTTIQDAIVASVANALDNALLGAPLPLDADQPAGLYQKIVGSATDYGQDFANTLQFSLARIADLNSGDQLGFIGSNVMEAFMSVTAVSASLSQRSILESMPANYRRVFNGRMNAFDGQGTPAPGAGEQNLHAFYGPFASHLMTVLFGGGIEIAVNSTGDAVFSRGAIQIRCMTDADILCRDAGRFGMSWLQNPAV